MGDHGRFFAAPLSQSSADLAHDRAQHHHDLRLAPGLHRQGRNRHLGAGFVVDPLMIRQIFDEARCSATRPNGRHMFGAHAPTCAPLLIFVGIMVLIRSSPVRTISARPLSNLVGLQVVQDLHKIAAEHLQYMPLRFFHDDPDQQDAESPGEQ